MKSLYDLVDINISGVLTYARPVEFDIVNGEPISIIKIVTTCPKCSALNEYVVSISDNNKVYDFECTTCNPNKNQPQSENNKPVVKSNDIKKSDFVDPIELGLFNVEQV